MASGKGTYLATKALDGVLGGTDFVQPGTVYIALYTVAPGAGGGGTEVVIGVNGYVRCVVVNNAGNWPAAVAGVKANGATFTFPVAVGGDWGVIVAAAIWDAPAAGNLLYFGNLAAPKTVLNGDTFRFLTGSITLTES